MTNFSSTFNTFDTHMYAHNNHNHTDLDTHMHTNIQTGTHIEYLWTVLTTGLITETSYLAHLCTYAPSIST